MISFASSLVTLIACLSLTSAAPTRHQKHFSTNSKQTYTLLFLDSTQNKSYALQYGYEGSTASKTKTICKPSKIAKPFLESY